MRNEIKRYIKKPIPVEAIQIGNDLQELRDFAGDNVWIEMIQDRDKRVIKVIKVKTLGGVVTAHRGDYIIKGIHGEFYPCEGKIFEESYDEVI